MPLDYEVRRPTRRCAATGEPIAPGDAYVATIVIDDRGETTRRDFAASQWSEQPDGAVAWWRARLPKPGARKPQAPREAVLALLDEWADRPEEAAARYLLALLAVRRRFARLATETSPFAQHDTPTLRLRIAERDDPIEVAVVEPTSDQRDAVQQRLASLLEAA
ncbi:MAG: hypothetical protein AAF805_02830 [Planctomycetota bacterium]